jgi:hypothetical protein
LDLPLLLLGLPLPLELPLLLGTLGVTPLTGLMTKLHWGTRVKTMPLPIFKELVLLLLPL